jgi:hypothetical protein
MYRSNLPQHETDDQTATQVEGLIAFLAARLTEDLARIWTWDKQDPGTRPRPGVAAQVAVVDDLLRTLSAARLPARFELRIMLFGYCRHPDYDPRWADLLQVDSAWTGQMLNRKKVFRAFGPSGLRPRLP